MLLKIRRNRPIILLGPVAQMADSLSSVYLLFYEYDFSIIHRLYIQYSAFLSPSTSLNYK